MSESRLQKLRDKQSQLQAQIRSLAARERQQERKNDTRRKVILGAFMLEHMAKNRSSVFTKTLLPLLDEYVTRPQDRQLLNAHFEAIGLDKLPPIENPTANDAGAPEGSLRAEFKK